jgi:bacteriocin-like protein
MLKPETVKALSTSDLANVIGGVTVGQGCVHPTTTVQPTGPC